MVKSFYLKKRGQMKIQQTAFVLIAVTMFFILIGMFFLNMQLSKMEDEATKEREREALTLVSRLANSPEFSCGSSFEGESRGTCIDFDKVMSLKDNIEEYEDFWEVEGIELVKVYPSEESRTECTRENYPDCNKITIIESNKTGKESFVSLCRKNDLGYYTKSNCEVGKLIVKYEEIE